MTIKRKYKLELVDLCLFVHHEPKIQWTLQSAKKLGASVITWGMFHIALARPFVFIFAFVHWLFRGRYKVNEISIAISKSSLIWSLRVVKTIKTRSNISQL